MTSTALTPRVAGLILAVCVITTFQPHAFAQGTVSKDGKRMTDWQGGTNAAGVPRNEFLVYDKQ